MNSEPSASLTTFSSAMVRKIPLTICSSVKDVKSERLVEYDSSAFINVADCINASMATCRIKSFLTAANDLKSLCKDLAYLSLVLSLNLTEPETSAVPPSLNLTLIGWAASPLPPSKSDWKNNKYQKLDMDGGRPTIDQIHRGRILL